MLKLQGSEDELPGKPQGASVRKWIPPKDESPLASKKVDLFSTSHWEEEKPKWFFRCADWNLGFSLLVPYFGLIKKIPADP